jgi:prepilin-type N-terminal cleavage/methylation domain-containing protein
MSSLFSVGGHPRRATAKAAQEGFTFTELLIGLTIIALVGSTVLFGLNRLNTFASVNRLYTVAQTLAQNQIDLILTKGPFDPAQNKYPRLNGTDPTSNILRTDVTTYYSNPSTPTQLYTAPPNPPVELYKDPMNNNAIVTGNIATSIKTTPFTAGSKNNNLNVRQASVTVSYTFRSKPYSITMNTMRTPDQ